MAGVNLERVSRIYAGPVAALQDVSLEVRDGEFLVLVGPSGSGKTTLLRLIAGLDRASEGEIRIGGVSVGRVPARQRDVAMVFQSYALYPHRTVARNLAMALELRWRKGGWAHRLDRWLRPARARQWREELDRRVQDAARILGIEELLPRLPAELSGGQRQRVALGRALVRQPAVYLFDEPLSNLDARLRVTLRGELKQLHRRIGATMIYVTHDQEEALALGDRVAVLDAGRLQQIGTPEEVTQRPRNRFVAGFLGVPQSNFIEGRLEAIGGEVQFVAEGWTVTLDRQVAGRVQPYLARRTVMAVRPVCVRLESADVAGGVVARVAEIHTHDGTARVCIGAQESVGVRGSVGARGNGNASCGTEETESLMSGTLARARVAVGDLVSMHLDMRQANFFDPETGENIDWPPVVEGN